MKIISIAPLSFLLCTISATSLLAQTPALTTSGLQTKLVLLGTGTPIPDPDRSGPATAIVVGDWSCPYPTGQAADC